MFLKLNIENSTHFVNNFTNRLFQIMNKPSQTRKKFSQDFLKLHSGRNMVQTLNLTTWFHRMSAVLLLYPLQINQTYLPHQIISRIISETEIKLLNIFTARRKQA